MSDFNYVYLVVYNSNGTFSFDTEGSGSVPDLDDDDRFEDGDIFETSVDWEYDGTIERSGIVAPIFQAPSGSRIAFFESHPGDQTGIGLFGSLGVRGGDFIFCLLEGTAIATPDGPRAIETLTVGDLVLTPSGTSVPVKFNLRQTVSTRFGPSERLRPVRIAAGALGQGVPERDLTLTADHALYLDGMLINAGALVNGTTITRVPLAEFSESYTVYHIETEAHDLILAEGAAAETFIDYGARKSFDNYAEYLALYGADGEIVEQEAPRITRAAQMPPALRARLAGAATAAA